LDIPSAWEGALQAIAKKAKLCLIIGPVDAGKSTFCLLAADFALALGRKPAWVDADPGQPDLSPPAALGAAIVKKPRRSQKEATPAGFYFIGDTSPVGHISEVAGGAQTLTQRVRRKGADLVIVNTGGLVQGGIARALKMAKVRLLEPSHLVSIAPGGETEGILAGLRGRRLPVVYRLSPSRQVMRRTPEERRRRRQSLFAQYFRRAAEVKLSFTALTLHGASLLSGKEAKGLERSLLENLLVGLFDHNGEDRALGIITGVDFYHKRLTVLTPFHNSEKIAGLRVGFMQLAADGTELGNLPASTWS
jgi:polynucleotide 5'-hydroxyl-kinase GRC3/NOL9